MNYLDDANAFKVGKMNESIKSKRRHSIVTNNPKILNDLAEGNLDSNTSREENYLNYLMMPEFEALLAQNRQTSR